MPPISAGVDLAAEHLALDRDADRGDVDDRELALRSSLPTSILTPSIEPENSSPAMPLMPVTLADSDQHEVGRVVLDVGPLMPIASILIGSQLGHLKLSPSARADAQEHAEAGLGDERAVAEEREVAGLAADHQRADRHLGADRAEADHLLVGRGRRCRGRSRGR